MRIPLTQGFYKARSIISSAQRCVNLYPEKNPDDAPVPYTLYPTAGLRLLKGDPLFTPPRPNPPGTRAIWAVTTSCKFLPFVPTDTGNVAPLIPLTAVAPTGTPRTLTLYDIDVDSAGNQYVLRSITNTGVGLDSFEIDVFASGTTGSPATITRSIAGASTNLSLFGNSQAGGLCLDTAQQYIYAANEAAILRFPIDASGDATGTVLVNTSGVIFTRIYYDNPRSFLWVSCGAGDGPGIRAYDLNGTLKRTISCSLYWNVSDSIDSVAIDSNGLIYGLIGNKRDDNGDFASIVYVFAANASGDSVPVRRIQAVTGGAGAGAGVDVDAVTGNVFICYNSPPSHIISVPNVDGIVSSFTTDISGAATLLDYDFGDPSTLDGVQEIRIIYHYP